MVALLKKAAGGILKSAFAPAAGGKVTGVAHAILVAVVLVALWRLNVWLWLDRVVHAPSRLLRELWLPLLFGLGYLLVWIALWTWRAFSEPSVGSLFPDIDEAWRSAVSGMGRWGVDLVEKPLVLVLGHPSTHESALLAALGVTPTFGPLPGLRNSPVSVVADDRATYVLCQEASALSLGAEKLAHRRAAKRVRGAVAADKTIAVEAAMPAALRATKGGVEQPSATGLLEGEVAIPLAISFDDLEDADLTGGVRPPLMTPEQLERASLRLRHLLKLVARSREPVLPVDAVAVAFPCDAIEHPNSASQMAEAMRRDLGALDEAGVRCPVVAIGVDLQHVRGAGRMLHLLPSDRKARCYGAKLPGGLSASEEVLREALQWLTGPMTQTLCRRLYQFDPAGRSSLADNAALHDFLSEMGRRGELLANLLVAGLEGEDGEAWPCVGAFLVATGDPLGGSQAFGGGVLDSLLEQSTRGSWTDEAFLQDKLRTRGIAFGYAALGLAAMLVIGLLVV